jgi:hypothetical protein
MCGSATLAMVVSSDCMSVANITQSVIPPRWGVLGLSSSDIPNPQRHRDVPRRRRWRSFGQKPRFLPKAALGGAGASIQRS